MNAEARAKELAARFFDFLSASGSSVSASQQDSLESIVASALRRAENDKLEEARQRILEGHDEAWGNPAEQHGWDQAAERVAALKSKGTP